MMTTKQGRSWSVVMVCATILMLGALGACGDTTASSPDGGVDAAPDAEPLADCTVTCPADALTPWPESGPVQYEICLPSYQHCAPAPSCNAACMGEGDNLQCGKQGWCLCTSNTTHQAFACTLP